MARPSVALAATAAALSLTAGCGNETENAFKDRPKLPSCGSFDVGGRAEPPQAAVDCLMRALGGEAGAELVVTRQTVEGAPVVSYYRALPGRRTVELFQDNTRDTFGSRAWVHFLCQKVSAAPLRATDCDQP